MIPWMVEQWSERLDQLSRRHYKDPVTIEVIGLEIGDQFVVRRAALEGISLEDQDASRAVSIQVATMKGGHTERRILAPVNVHLKQTELGDDELLAVEAADGTVTLVHFERALERLGPDCLRGTF